MVARVLVVEDDDQLRTAIAVMFKRAGYEVETADDAAPAMSSPSHFDLVVVDFHMKTVTGDQVIRHFKERSSKVYCAVLTASDDPGIRATCRAAGADAFFSKPTRPSLLKHALIAAVPALRTVEET